MRSAFTQRSRIANDEEEHSDARLIHVFDENLMFSAAALLLRHLKFALNGTRI